MIVGSFVKNIKFTLPQAIKMCRILGKGYLTYGGSLQNCHKNFFKFFL